MTQPAPPTPLRVAVVGSGPSGFYAAEALFKAAAKPDGVPTHVDLFERLPTPYGLVRGGVAPDHQKVKKVTRVYEKTAARPQFRFFGHVELGRDVTVEDLRAHYHQIIYAVGNEGSRRLGIPGEGMPRSTPATVFVGWYNGHPDYQKAKIGLSARRVVVVGNGNVAVDVARILLRTPAELAKTDIAGHALSALSDSSVEEVILLGRRGPAQAAFTPGELKELGQLEAADVIVDPADLALDPVSEASLADNPKAAKNMALLRRFAERGATGKPKRLIMRFFVSPTEVLPTSGQEDEPGVGAVVVERNQLVPRQGGGLSARGTGELETLEAQLFLPAIGFTGTPIAGVPFDPQRKRIPNEDGRVLYPADHARAGAPVPNQYVVGWARTGPQGLIGMHKNASAHVVGHALADLATGDALARPLPHEGAIIELLEARQVPFVTFEDWRRLDQVEVARGDRRGAPRDKLTDVSKMLKILNE